jgi:hypothetical protein
VPERRGLGNLDDVAKHEKMREHFRQSLPSAKTSDHCPASVIVKDFTAEREMSDPSVCNPMQHWRRSVG